MKIKSIIAGLLLLNLNTAEALVEFSKHSQQTYSNVISGKHSDEDEEYLDFNPFASDAASIIKEMDIDYEQNTNLKALITTSDPSDLFEMSDAPKCYRSKCHIYIDIQRSKQELNLYRDGNLIITTRTSTGRAGFATPNFDTNPNGRIYQVYSSTKYPGYNNMPYAIFISGGFAIHGAPGSEDAHLGQPASHGCVRVRTSVAKEINAIVAEAVKQAGGSTKSIWITVRS